jgi:hypothetical protein
MMGALRRGRLFLVDGSEEKALERVMTRQASDGWETSGKCIAGAGCSREL